jgi:hypothetical protein
VRFQVPIQRVRHVMHERRHLTLWRRNSAGRHMVTVIVVHNTGRRYLEAIIFTTTAP